MKTIDLLIAGADADLSWFAQNCPGGQPLPAVRLEGRQAHSPQSFHRQAAIPQTLTARAGRA